MDQHHLDENFGEDGAVIGQNAPVLEVGDQPSKEFLELFSKLDSTINGELIEKAWKQYDTVGQQIVLEGNQSAWMCCAFFTTVWQATPIGQPGLVCRYSLSALLELCELSVLEFFDKLNSWTELIMASRRLQEHVKRVQANLAVAAVIYKKYLSIFRHVFAHVPAQPQTRQSPQKRARYSSLTVASSLQKLSSAALFEFIWLMFVALRKQFATSQEDLLHSFHLLLCLVDHVFVALLDAGQQRHLQMSFVRSLSATDQSPLEALCAHFEGVTLDAKQMRAHWLVPRLQKMAEDEFIVGFDDGNEQQMGGGEDGAGGGGLLAHIEENKKSFEQIYEQKLHIRSEVDERIFLAPALSDNTLIFEPGFEDDAVSILRKSGPGSGDLRTMNIDLMLKISTQNCMEKLAADRQPRTRRLGAAGKSYVITPETVCPNTNTLVAEEAKQSQKLWRLLIDFKGVEDEFLVYLFDDCQENPREFVMEQISTFSQMFMAKLNAESVNDAEFDAEFQLEAPKRAEKIELLFYYLLRAVVTHDRERAVHMHMEMQLDMGMIFQNRDFLASVYICALELVLFAHHSVRQFPWSAELFEGEGEGQAPINFYKIFELVIRADTGLSKEAVKHLNKVEESVLDELAWRSGSPLWRILEVSRSVESFAELSSVPSSQILSRNAAAYVERNIDLPPPTITFFKKVYHLAAIRLTDLCERVRVVDELTRHKVWTLFEHVFRTQAPVLLRDRHLDQLLMCCVYIIARVCGLADITFQNIIYHYRHQPQSSSRVYRKVLIDAVAGDDEPDSKLQKLKLEDNPKREYGDLIKFYNTVFVRWVEDFVKLLHPTGTETKENIVPLISLPKLALNPLSPRKIVAERINVIPMSQYVHSVGATTQAQRSGGGGFAAARGRYDFHRSPSKDLRQINSMLMGNGGSAGAGAVGNFHDYME